MDVTVEMIQSVLEFEEKMILRSCISTFINTTIGIAVFFIVAHHLLKILNIAKPKNRIITIICIALVFVLGSVSITLSNWKMWQRTIGLKADLDEINVISSIGKVEDSYAYEKGGIAVVIGGLDYYIMPQLGDMKVNMEFEYYYLANSRFIVSFKVLNDKPIPENAAISEDVFYRFGDNEYKPIENIYSLDDSTVYNYVKNYYRSISLNKCQDFVSIGWMIYTYYIEEGDMYRSDFMPSIGDTWIYLIFDTSTGKPIYFWQEGNDF